MPEKRYARRDPNEIVDIEHRDRLEDYVEPASGTVTVAHIVYGLHSISILTGLLTAGLSIAGAFVFSGPPSLPSSSTISSAPTPAGRSWPRTSPGRSARSGMRFSG